MNHNLRL